MAARQRNLCNMWRTLQLALIASSGAAGLKPVATIHLEPDEPGADQSALNATGSVGSAPGRFPPLLMAFKGLAHHPALRKILKKHFLPVNIPLFNHQDERHLLLHKPFWGS